MSLRKFWNCRNFWNFGKFWIFKRPFWREGQKYWQFFFVIFGQVDVFYILVEFEVDGMRPNKSTKNTVDERALTGLIAHFLSISRPLTISTIKITLEKKLMSLRRFWFFCLLITWDISVFLTCWGWLGRFNFQIERDSMSLKSFWRCAEVFFAIFEFLSLICWKFYKFFFLAFL